MLALYIVGLVVSAGFVTDLAYRRSLGKAPWNNLVFALLVLGWPLMAAMYLLLLLFCAGGYLSELADRHL